METKDKETFNYTYSAKEQDEIKAIRKKYSTPEDLAKVNELLNKVPNQTEKTPQ